MRSWVSAAFILALEGCSSAPRSNLEQLAAYQIGKARQPAEVIFLGDSSLGYSIDAELWAHLSGKTTTNLALSAAYGYAGDLVMLGKVLETGTPAEVIFMHTADLLQRPTPEAALIDALKTMTPIAAPGTAIVNDYIAQLASRTYPADTPGFQPASITSVQVPMLREIAAICTEHAIRCTYAHGPLVEPICSRSGDYLAAANAAIEQAGLSVLPGTPLCVPAGQIGDTYDHIEVAAKPEFTLAFARLYDYRVLFPAPH